MKTFDPNDLSDLQKEYIKEHALELWEATMVPPADEIDDILSSVCSCCIKKRHFLRVLMSL
jgi:hypothetical protein